MVGGVSQHLQVGCTGGGRQGLGLTLMSGTNHPTRQEMGEEVEVCVCVCVRREQVVQTKILGVVGVTGLQYVHGMYRFVVVVIVVVVVIDDGGGEHLK